MEENNNFVKKRSRFKIVGIIATAFISLILIIIFFTKFIFVVPTGRVGVIYSLSNGVKDYVLDPGMHLISPLYKVKIFTVGNEQLILSKNATEGSETDESFSVATKDNANINISFQMSYRYKKDRVIETYKNFKGMDGHEIIDNRVRTVLKSKISEITSQYSMMDIYSGNRAKISNEITECLNKEFDKKYGLEILDASIIDVHPDEKLKESIDNRVRALQEKQQAEIEKEKVKIQEETEIIKAEADAKIKVTKAKAEAEANKLLSESITQELVDMKEAEARLKHGWVTIQGADTIVTKTE